MSERGMTALATEAEQGVMAAQAAILAELAAMADERLSALPWITDEVGEVHEFLHVRANALRTQCARATV